jgi:hypothetical protein
MPGSEQDAHHTPAPGIGRNCWALHQNGRGAPTKCSRIASEGLDARMPIFLLAYRASTHDTSSLTLASLVFGRELRLPAICCLGHPPNRTTLNRSRCKFSGPSTWHPQLRPPTPGAGQWPDENSFRQTGQLRGLPQGRQSVALSLNPHEGKITQASILVGRPIQGSHPNKWCVIQDPEEPQVEDGGSTLGLAGTLSVNRSGQAAFRREEWEKLQGNHRENRATGKEDEADHRHYKQSPRKRRNGSTPVGYSGWITLSRKQCSM